MIQKRLLLFFIALLPVVVTSCHDDDDDLIGLWEQVADFNGSPRFGAAYFTFEKKQKGYILGGFYADQKSTKDSWIYDIARNRWDRIENEFPGIARHFSMATVCEAKGKAYYGMGYYSDYDDGTTLTFFDGTTEKNPTSLYDFSSGRLWDFWELDLDTHEWTRMPDFPGAEQNAGPYNGIAFSIGDKVYFGLGYDNDGAKAEIYEFDTNTNRWNPTHIGFPGNKRTGASVFVIDEKAYVVGGENNNTPYPTFYCYDPAINSWKELNRIVNYSSEDFDDDYTSIERSNGCAFVIDGYGYLTCGSRTNTWRYDPKLDLWEEVHKFKGQAREFAAAFSTGSYRGAIVTCGRSGTTYYDDAWRLDPYTWDDDD